MLHFFLQELMIATDCFGPMGEVQMTLYLAER